HAHGEVRHRRCRPRPRIRSRRLCAEAVRAQGAHRSCPCPTADLRAPGPGAADRRRRRRRRGRSHRDQGRLTGVADTARIRSARGLGPQALAGLLPGDPPRSGLGLPSCRRHPAGQCPRPASALEDRTRSGEAGHHRHRPRRRLYGRQSRVSPESAAGGTLRSVASGLRTFWNFILRSFSHSLQVRIVVLTIVLTSVAIFGVGTYMSQQIARGLFDTRLDSLSSQTRSILSELRSLAPVDGQAVTQDTLSSQLSSIYNRSADSVYSLTLEPKDPNSSFSTITAGEANEEGEAAEVPISDELRDAMRTAPADDKLYQSVSLPDGTGPGLLITQELQIPGAGQFQLYYLGDLTEQQDTLSFVQRSML